MTNKKFELLLHRLKRGDFLLDLAEPFTADSNDLFHLCRLAKQRAGHPLQRAMEIKKLLDFSQCEPDCVIAADKHYAIEMLPSVVAVPGRSPRRSREQPLPLVKTNGLNVDSSGASQFSNLHARIIHPILRYKASDTWQMFFASSRRVWPGAASRPG